VYPRKEQQLTKLINKSPTTIKYLLGVLAKKRRKQSCIFEKKSAKNLKASMKCWSKREMLSEEDEYSINPFKAKLVPAKLRDRSATCKEQEIALVTMNDISGLD